MKSPLLKNVVIGDFTLRREVFSGPRLQYPPGLRVALNPFDLSSSLVHLKLNFQIEDVPAHSFDGCGRLESVFVGPSVRVIGAQAFRGCSKLRTLEVRPGLETLGSRVFEGCVRLERVTLPESVKSMG